MNDADILRKEVEKYTDFRLGGRKINIPYCLRSERFRFWKTSGKGTPEEIRGETKRAAQKEGKVLGLLPDHKVTKFMRKRGIGVECSGFVYNCLKGFLETKDIDIADCFKRFPGKLGEWEKRLIRYKRVRRISADDLTSDMNTVPVKAVQDTRPGDLIRLTPLEWQGKHVALVVEVAKGKLIYAHSSKSTLKQGPHFAEIEITDPRKGLEQQNWLEVTKDRRNYGKVSLIVENGDGVRRLKCLS